MFKGTRRTRQQLQQPKTPVLQRGMKGLLDIDGWRCNCNPRLLAVQYTTRGEGPNKGRKFYKCSNQDTGCEFFLWESEARSRENGLSSPEHNSNMSPHKTPVLPPTPITITRRHTRSNPDPLFSPTGIEPSRAKRRISDEQSNDSEESDSNEPYMDWRASANRSRGLPTPRKERKTSTQTSPTKSHNPAAQQPRFHWQQVGKETRTSPRFLQPANGLKTPAGGLSSRFFPSIPSTVTTQESDNIFTTPPVNPTRNSIFAPRPRTPPPPPTYVAPAPVTPRSNPLDRNIGSPGRGLQNTLITDVFTLLAKNSVNLKSSARSLRALLVRHVRQKEGISQGRESARQALARKNHEVAVLERKVWELEVEKGKMQEEVAELAHQLEQVKLSQSQVHTCESSGRSIDTTYLHIT